MCNFLHFGLATGKVDKYVLLMYMSRSFQNGAFNANSVFGKTNRSSTASDHVANIKSRALFRTSYANNCEKPIRCSNNTCNEQCSCSCNKPREYDDIVKKNDDQPSNKTNSISYEYLLNLRRGYVLDKNEIDNAPPFNQSDLVSGLYSTVNLCNVATVCSGVDECNDKIGVNPKCVPLYQFYRVDPDGELFGNTPCSINNYLNFVVLEE